MGTLFVSTKKNALHITYKSTDVTYQQQSDRNHIRKWEHKKILHSRLEKILIPRQGHGCFLVIVITNSS